jgi:hypothetical protein
MGGARTANHINSQACTAHVETEKGGSRERGQGGTRGQQVGMMDGSQQNKGRQQKKKEKKKAVSEIR